MKLVVQDLLSRLEVKDWPGRLVPHKASFYGKVISFPEAVLSTYTLGLGAGTESYEGLAASRLARTKACIVTLERCCVLMPQDAVSCLLATGHAKSVHEAVTLGSALLNQKVFSSVNGDNPFRNDSLLYRFAAHEDDRCACPPSGFER